MSNLLKISNIKNFTVFFSIALYIFLLIKIQFIDKTIILSDSVLIENCSDFSIFYLFENLLSFQNVRITFLDLNLKSSLPGSFINIEELVCIGRSIQLNGDISQNIIIGFDSYINNYFYIGIKSILFFFKFDFFFVRNFVPNDFFLSEILNHFFDRDKSQFVKKLMNMMGK